MSAEEGTGRDGTAVAGWLADRLGWSRLHASLVARRVPRNGVSHYFGGVTLFLFVLQVASGVLLMLYFDPDATQAHASVEHIVAELPYGKLVRATHVWASDLFVGFLVAHIFTVVLRRTFRAPRELGWLSGLLGLFLGVELAFTGSILPWSGAAQAGARVGSDLARYVPFVGEQLRRFMRGGEEVNASTLGHAFGFHVAALPAALTLTVALHVFLVSRAPPEPANAADARFIPLYPDFFVRGAALTTAVLVVLMTLVVFVERPLGAAADLAASSSGAHPPWYFLPVHEIVSVAPREMLGMDGARFLVGAACALSLVAVALPFLDRRGSRYTAWAAVAVLVVLLALSFHAIQ